MVYHSCGLITVKSQLARRAWGDSRVCKKSKTDPLSLYRFSTGHIIPSYFHLIRFSITPLIDNIGHQRAHLAEPFLLSPLTVLKTDEAQISTAIFEIAFAIKAKCHLQLRKQKHALPFVGSHEISERIIYFIIAIRAYREKGRVLSIFVSSMVIAFSMHASLVYCDISQAGIK